MTEPLEGKLVMQSSKRGKETVKVRRIIFPTKKGMSQPTQFDDAQLAPSLKDNKDESVEVHLELEGGKPVRIRPVGETWTAPAAPPPPRQAPAGKAWPGKGAGPKQAGQGRGQRPDPGFHNPYNFIPAVEPKDAGGLAQGAPIGHDRYHDGRWSGRIGIRLETVSPLLIPDAARARPHADVKDHPVFDLRTGSDGRPCLPPTSLKGALRSAYEAVTNSRLSVFQGHEVPLAHRMPASAKLTLIPARVTDDGKDIEFWPGSSPIPKSRTDPMHAAWLPRYRKGQAGVDRFAVKYPDNKLPQHGDRVVCWLQLFRHERRNFTYWRVVAIGRADNGPPKKPAPFDRSFGPHEPVAGEPLIQAHGHVCITNQNINSKHDERVFFVPDKAKPVRVDADMDKLGRDWKDLIKNYQDLHADDLKKRDKQNQRYDAYLGGEPGKTAWSRHVYTKEDRELTPGTLCYARRHRQTGEVTDLFPVMIARELADCAPDALLPESLKPATLGAGKTHAERFAKLSPADRVFGWASQKGDGAWRGQLRIGPIRCEDKDAIDRFDEPLPLAILSTAKPQQARFYVAADKDGTPQRDGISKADAAYGNADMKGLRGRKVFPHPAYVAGDTETATAYWDPQGALADAAPEAKAVPGGATPLYREYRRRGNVRDDQNRSIKAWVKPGVTFESWIDVINLNKAELGALLWLLSLEDGAVHRLGGGKPLGFGSVRITISSLDLADGEGKRQEYGNLVPLRPEVSSDHSIHAGEDRNTKDAIAAFKQAVQEAYGKGSPFEHVPFIAAFLTAARGFRDGLPIHYPRKSAAPDPEGKNYEWFVANDRTGRDTPAGNQLALGPLANDPGLPYWPEEESPQQDRRHPRR